MQVRERTRAGPRCPYCREAVEDVAVPCAACGVRLHVACARELGRCPTLGCADVAVPVASGPVGDARPIERPPDRARDDLDRFGRYARLACAGLLVLALLVPMLDPSTAPLVLPLTVVLLAVVLGLEGAWLRERRRVERFAGNALAVQPCPARPGATVQLTLTLSAGLAAWLAGDPRRSARVELRRVLRAPTPGVAPSTPWRRFLLGGAHVRDGVAVLALPVPAGQPDTAWELHLSSETPGFHEAWELPVEA